MPARGPGGTPAISPLTSHAGSGKTAYQRQTGNRLSSRLPGLRAGGRPAIGPKATAVTWLTFAAIRPTIPSMDRRLFLLTPLAGALAASPQRDDRYHGRQELTLITEVGCLTPDEMRWSAAPPTRSLRVIRVRRDRSRDVAVGDEGGHGARGACRAVLRVPGPGGTAPRQLLHLQSR